MVGMQIEDDIVKITGRIVEFVIGEKQLFLAAAETVLAGTLIGLHSVRAAWFPTVNGTQSEKRRKTESSYLF